MRNVIISSIPLLIAFIVSAIRYKKLKSDGLQLFTWFLLATFAIQVTGYEYSAILKKSNHFIFNGYLLIEYGFYLFVYYQSLNKDVLKKAVFFLGIFFFVFYIVEVLLLNSFLVYNAKTGNVGEFLTLICCFLYLSELLMADEEISFFVMPMFWITTGIMIATVGDFLYLCFFNYILKNNLDPHGAVYGMITTTTSVLEYTFITIGFICRNIWKKLN